MITEDDLAISATARSVGRLRPVLDDLARRSATAPPRSLVDLGCGLGGLTLHVGDRLGIDKLIGVDLDHIRVKEAAEKGIRSFCLDLDHDPLPFEDASVGLVTCFGLLSYLTSYDNCLAEVARVLEDGGWLIVSAPNLGGWVSRLSLLFGLQPGEIQVSATGQPGPGGRRRRWRARVGPPHLHATTLRCLRDLLVHHGFDVVAVRALPPEERRPLMRAVDTLLRWSPSLSRRFVILARTSRRASGPGSPTAG
jgi:SAM-dependent methyltransferase